MGKSLAVKHRIHRFFTVGNTVLRQALLANLFLYAYEANYMTDLISSDKVKARHFHSTKRFIDDLCALNDGGEFGRVHKDIYPNELVLKVTTKGIFYSWY